MNMTKFALLISYVTMIANRQGAQTLYENDVAEMAKLVNDMMPNDKTEITDSNVVTEAFVADLVKAIRANKKIEAIKIYRSMFNVGLKEAKDAVERMEA